MLFLILGSSSLIRYGGPAWTRGMDTKSHIGMVRQTRSTVVSVQTRLWNKKM